MPQNQSSNKLSSIIGFLLLAGIIGFTVFINFFVGQPIEEEFEEEEEVIIEVEEPKFRALDSTDLANLWKLEKLHTGLITESKNGEKTVVEIDKIISIEDFRDIINSENPDEFKNFKQKFIVDYGILSFEHLGTDKVIIDNIKIEHLKKSVTDSTTLKEIGNIYSQYQVQSISTETMHGEFTRVMLKDGREIFLVRAKSKVTEEYKRVIESADCLNDSTRIMYPY
ncbi:hypothetical protein ACE193_20845 [Bernardetia sp. OM2101]|uniref:hypothetical protein n=1 Tax=Bernardetia sp. OM2101 TaxID=3344876 RepID=UPI0035CED410